jgi:taurine dioxygenase
MLNTTHQDSGPEAIERIPVSPHLGLELRGLDLSGELDAAATAAIRDAWIDAGVLLFRGLGTSADIHMRLSRVFGELEPAATASLNDPNNPYLMTLAYHPGKEGGYQQHYTVAGQDRAGWLGWHWDQSFMPTIVRGAVLRMVEPAAKMGETGFIDAIAAYDRLSPEQKKRIEGLEVVYEFNPDFTSGQFGFPRNIQAYGGGKPSFNTGHNFDFPPVVHPLVITQHETGRKVLKLSPMHARYVLGMERAESDALLAEIADHLVDPRYAYFHAWGKDDLIVWDNWRVIHSANGVPLDCARVAQRTTIMCDYKVGRYLDATRDRLDVTRRIID